MSFASGTQFGIYLIGDPLGVGGMGEVYRATDTKLERQVAIKVLPESFARDADRVARFEREAKTLASLNHPNIGQIYGLEKQGDTTALVMELIEGPTLADRIAEGPLPPEEALRIARQIIDGLEAAHDKGIVHRDLKPANIKVKTDGQVKLLDFGIAKSIEGNASSGRHSPTMVTPAFTESGVIMGTAAYMSPEQARGKFVDQRTDIWAFGCLLLEMLTGQPAFGGDDVTVTLARIIERDADLDSIPGTISPSVRHTIKLCLKKDPKQRIRHIGDVRLAMAGVFAPDFQSGNTSAAGRPLWQQGLALALTAAVAAGITLAVTRQPTLDVAVAEVRRSIHTLPPDQALNFPNVPSLGISPDGSRVVYAAGGALYLRDLDELVGRMIPGTEGEIPIVPIFSPDGSWISYQSVAGNEFKRVSVEGGTPLPIVNSLPLGGSRWGDANTVIYAEQDCRIFRQSASGGAPELLAENPGFNCFEPFLLPGSDTLLFEQRPSGGAEAEIALQSLSTGEKTVLFPGKQAYYLEEGYLVYFEPTLGLMARTFDLQTLAYGGPVAMVDDILQQAAGGGTNYTLSPQGTLVYVKGEVAGGGQNGLFITDESNILRQLEVPLDDYRFPSVSPDGSQLVIQSNANIFIFDLAGTSELRQLTFQGANVTPTWSPDGEWITYVSNRDGTERIYWQRADGSGVAEALTEGAEGRTQSQPAWAPDGRLAYTATSEEGSDNDVWIVSIPLGKPELLVGGQGNQSQVAFSPGGRAMAYASTASGGTQEIRVEPFPPDGSSVRVSDPATVGVLPVWAGLGNRLSYQSLAGGGTFPAVDISIPGFAISNRRVLDFTSPINGRAVGAFPDSDQLIMAIPPQNSREALTTELIVVENWIEEVKRRVPRE